MRFISKGGVCHPEKERVALRNNSGKTIKNPSEEGSKYAGESVPAGAEYIYEGPCRAALLHLWNEKTETLGQDFRYDIELTNRVRQIYGMSIEDYLKFIGYDQVKIDKEFEKRASKVSLHELPKKVEAIDIAGGGSDTAGSGQDKKGGFGDYSKQLNG